MRSGFKTLRGFNSMYCHNRLWREQQLHEAPKYCILCLRLLSTNKIIISFIPTRRDEDMRSLVNGVAMHKDIFHPMKNVSCLRLQKILLFFSRLALWLLRHMIRFYREELLAPRSTPKLEDHPLSAIYHCLFNIFAATLNTGGRSSIRNLRTCNVVVTRTQAWIVFGREAQGKETTWETET